MRWMRNVLWMAVFLFVILFSMQNKDWVTVRFGFSPLLDQQWVCPPVPLFLVILCSLLLGILIGWGGGLYRRLQLRRAVGQYQKTIESMEKESQFFRRSPTQ
jgi:lipopolysaccharide assembly protein A